MPTRKAPAPAAATADKPRDGAAAKQRGGVRAGVGAKRKEVNTPGMDAADATTRVQKTLADLFGELFAKKPTPTVEPLQWDYIRCDGSENETVVRAAAYSRRPREVRL